MHTPICAYMQFYQMCSFSKTSPWSSTQLYNSKTPLCGPFSATPIPPRTHPSPLADTNLFSISVTVLFHDRYTKMESCKHMSFQDGHFSTQRIFLTVHSSYYVNQQLSLIVEEKVKKYMVKNYQFV